MRFDFTPLPGGDTVIVRPMLPVTVEGLPRAPQLCLIDTGSLHNRFGAWVAEAAGIELGSAEPELIALGGFTSQARTTRVQLAIGDMSWEAPVSFCDPWPLGFHLLGQEGFLRYFRVDLRAALDHLEVTLEGEGGSDVGS